MGQGPVSRSLSQGRGTTSRVLTHLVQDQVDACVAESHVACEQQRAHNSALTTAPLTQQQLLLKG
jgi:hypothetical protein